jgi:two-component system response regulator AgrA
VIDNILKVNGIHGEIVCKASNVEEVEDYLKNNSANLFFIDIELKSSENGYDLAKKIRETDCLAYIVFFTGHFEYALHAFKVKAFDFLTKPVVLEVLEQCILRIDKDYKSIMSQGEYDNKFIHIKSENCLFKIRLKDIIFIEKSGFKVNIYTVNDQISCYGSLERLSSALNDQSLIRCHKSFIANMSYISKIDYKSKELFFTTGHKCYIGDKYKDYLRIESKYICS